MVGLANDQRRVHVVSKGAFIKNVKNSYSCKWSIKKIINEDASIPQDFPKEGFENKPPWVVKIKYLANWKEKKPIVMFVTWDCNGALIKTFLKSNKLPNNFDVVERI
jgi:hypothetical protein